MGTVHCRKGTGPAKVEKPKLEVEQQSPAKGYFIVSFKGDKISVVNAETQVLILLGHIIKRQSRILSEGWERPLTWSY